MMPSSGWATAPGYVVLLGDANSNMQGNMTDNAGWWDPNEPSYVVTDLKWIDNFQGMVPVDHYYTTLIGDDLIPDIALGRITAQTLDEANITVDKIIQYESNHTNSANNAWLDNMVFVADANDPNAGQFCDESIDTGNYIHGSMDLTFLCLDDYETSPGSGTYDVEGLRTQLATELINGTSIVNYRGHGAINSWSSEQILSVSNLSFWDNLDKPVVIFSMDCLDGDFTRPGFPALSESILTYSDVDGAKGSAAHWSSTGLGFDYEHDVLAKELFEGMFQAGLLSIGDAINYSKMRYLTTTSYNEFEALSSPFQGDPAMQMFRPDLSVTKSTTATMAAPGTTVDYLFEISNNGVYPSITTLVDSIPAGFTYITPPPQQPLPSTAWHHWKLASR